MSISSELGKFILVVTNWVAIAPILFSENWRDTLLIGFASLTSAFHHSIEELHEGPALIETDSPRLQWFSLQTDRFFAALAVLGLASFKQIQEEWVFIVSAFLAGFTSEHILGRGRFHGKVKYRRDRILLHSYWHLMMEGFLAYNAVTKYRDERKLIDFIFPLISE